MMSIDEMRAELEAAGYIASVEGENEYYTAIVGSPDEWEYRGKAQHVRAGQEDALYAQCETEAVTLAWKHYQREKQFQAMREFLQDIQAQVDRFAQDAEHRDVVRLQIVVQMDFQKLKQLLAEMPETG